MAITGEVPGFSRGQIQAGLVSLGASLHRWAKDSSTLLVIGKVFENGTLPWEQAKGAAACQLIETAARTGGACRLRLVDSDILLEVFKGAGVAIQKLEIGPERSFAKRVRLMPAGATPHARSRSAYPHNPGKPVLTAGPKGEGSSVGGTPPEHPAGGTPPEGRSLGAG